MCLKPRSLPPIPDNTRSVAEQIYPPNHPMRRLGEDYADVLCDQAFADFSRLPASQPFRPHFWPWSPCCKGPSIARIAARRWRR